MGADSKIEWTDATWNPTRGCSVCSPGCKHCYAMKVAARFSGRGLAYEGLAFMHPKAGGQWTGKVRLVEEQLDAPLRWTRPRRIFVNSMSDLFHEELSVEDIARVFAVMYLAPRHTFQVLTKRAARMRAVLADDDFTRIVRRLSEPHLERFAKVPWPARHDPTLNPAPWVHLGVSVESQEYADERIHDLEETPAAVRFISGEPLLGHIDLRLPARSPWHPSPPATWLELAWPDWVPLPVRAQIEQFYEWHGGPRGWLASQDGYGSGVPGLLRPALGERGEFRGVGPGEKTVTGRYVHAWNNIGRVVTDEGAVEVVSGALGKRRIDWVIVGGESGPGARPLDLTWVRSIVEQCRAAAVPVFVKQLGAKPYETANVAELGAARAGDIEAMMDRARTHPVPAGWTRVTIAATGESCLRRWPRLKSVKGGDMAEWPEDLRVREFPKVTGV